MPKRPPYEPDCCCYKDPLEIRNHPGLALTPDDAILLAENENVDIPCSMPVYLFRNAVSI